MKTKYFFLTLTTLVFISSQLIGQCTFNETYSSSTGWTGSGFTISGGVMNYNDNGHGTGGCALAGGTPYIARPAYTLGNAWVWDIDVLINSSSLVAFQLASLTDGSVPVCFTNQVNLVIGTSVNQLYLSVTGGSSSAIAVPLGAWRFVRIERLSPEDFVLNVFTDAARTIQAPGSPVNLTVPSPGPQGLNTLAHLGCQSCGPARVINADLDNVCIWDVTPLPITLFSFTAFQYKNNVQLDWTTASEINNDFFTIERSTDAINFKSIATIKGAGNSNTLQDYSFIDNNLKLETLNSELLYYRIKQTDFDGTVSYSPIQSVVFQYNYNETFKVIQNASLKELTILLEIPVNNISLYIINMHGNVVYKSILDDKKTKLSTKDISTGVYLIYLFDKKQLNFIKKELIF